MRAGYVPLDRVGPVVASLIKERWPDGSGATVLADKVGCDEKAIRNILYPYAGNENAEFDLVDRVFCALGTPFVWYGVLSDIYQAVEFMETCALPSCQKKFRESTQARGGKKLYCSRQCQSLAAQVRDGKATGERLRQRGKCLNGHKLTPENRIQGNRCRTCKRERDKAWAKAARDRNPEKHREAVRRYQAKQKAKA